MRVLPIVLVSGLAGASDKMKQRFLDEYASNSAAGSRASFETVYKQADSIQSLSRLELDNLVRKGVPTVLKGVADSLIDLRNLSCDKFAEKWPSTPMRAEYTGSPTEVMVQLGDKSSWINNTRSPSGITLPEDCDSEDSKGSRPSVSPYVLHIKDRVKRSIKQEISRMFPGLPQAQQSPQTLLDAHTRDSIEFWFQQVGGGTFAHNDGYCHSVMSVQLRGKKKWSFMLSPEIHDLSRDVFDEFDSGIYRSGVHSWAPDFEMILEEGDAVFFPPGYMHETRTVDGPSAEDQCATSMTFNVPLPMPSRFIRTFLNRFSASPEVSHCMNRWESFFTMNSSLTEWETPLSTSTLPTSIASRIMSLVDQDRDGTISLEEVETYFFSQDANVVGFFEPGTYNERFGDMMLMFDPRYKLSESMIREGLEIRAKDTLEMWDIDRDGLATLDEISRVIDYFQYYKFRANLIQRATSFSDPETGESGPLEIGSELFKERLTLVDEIMNRIRPIRPALENLDTLAKDEL